MTTELAWQEAYKWLCQQRKNAPADSDVWHLRFHWAAEGAAFRERVEQGKYRLKPMRVVNRVADEPVAMWNADDALVLKWVALQIQEDMPVHAKCHHVKGTGVHYSRREVKTALDSGEYKFVYRTDIRGYYQHMQKNQLNALVEKWVKDPVLLDLTKQYIAYSVEDGGEFHTPINGISRGCALSPMIGASFLFYIDELFEEKKDLFYVRYMDDFLVLSKKRWPLRRAIRVLNEQMNAGGFSLHPDKTQIGRVEKGFDWLGLWFDVDGVRRSPRSLQTRANKNLRLYERLRPTTGRSLFARTLNPLLSTQLIVASVMLPAGSAAALTFDAGTIALYPSQFDFQGVLSDRLSGYVDSGDSYLSLVTTLSNLCSKTIPGLAYSPYISLIADPSSLYYKTSMDDPTRYRYGFPLPSMIVTTSFVDNPACSAGSGSAPAGPFSETIATLYQTLTPGGPVIFSDPVTVEGTLINASCSVDSPTISFGTVDWIRLGTAPETRPIDLKINCNAQFPGYAATSLVFSSSNSYSDVFLSNPDSGVGVQILVDGRTVVPGIPSPIRSGSSFSAVLTRSDAAPVSGDFSIVVDVTLDYP